MSRNKRVVVIGAGASGLAAIKSCLEENLSVVCFEKRNGLGGVWCCDSDEIVEGNASALNTTVTNMSKEMYCFSDYPHPKEFPTYLSKKLVASYLKSYGHHFNLVEKIKFEHAVRNVEPCQDFEDAWRLIVEDLKSGVKFEEVFDFVMVCSGHFGTPLKPKFKGMENFSGDLFHIHDVKNYDQFKNRKIVVVGARESACDAAVETSLITDKTPVYLSMRSGCFLFPRSWIFGLPFDFVASRKCILTSYRYLPVAFFSWFTQFLINLTTDHNLYQLFSTHRIFGELFVINDILPSRILTGNIAIKGDIVNFTQNGVIFEGDNFVTEVDVVILGTGYEQNFSLEKKFVEIKKGKCNLYRHIIPPKFPTLGIVGKINGLGPAIATFEMQSRWLVNVFLKRVKLPTEYEMNLDIQNFNNSKLTFGIRNLKSCFIADWMLYMETLAFEFGAKPNMIKILFADPKLFFYCIFGQYVPYQFRLQGPKSWKGARNAILTSNERIFWHLASTRPKPENHGLIKIQIKISMFVIISLYFCLYIFQIV